MKINKEIVVTILLAALYPFTAEGGIVDPDITDPPYVANAPLLSKRFDGQKFLGIVKIVRVQELSGENTQCGYSYSARIIKQFKGGGVDPNIEFTSFQPGHFVGGAYYLMFFDEGSTTLKRVSIEKSDKISIEGMGEEFSLQACNKKFDKFYADSENAFHIAPSLSDFFGRKWVIVNSYSNRIDKELENDTKGTSPCLVDEAAVHQCVKLGQMLKFICKHVAGVNADACK